MLGLVSIWMGRPVKKLGRRGLLHFFSSRLKEGEVLIANSSTDVFLHLNRQRLGKNTDEGQNRKKAVAIQKWRDALKRRCLCHSAVVRKVKIHFRMQE